MAGAIILGVMYGMDIDSSDSGGYLSIVKRAIHSITEIGNTGSYLGECSET